VKTHQGIMLLIRNYHRSHLNFFGSCLILFVACIIVIEANEVVPNDLSSSNQQAPVYHQQASSSLTNFNWLPGADTPTQYASDSDTSPSYDAEEDTLLGEGSYSNRRKYRRKGNRKRVKGRKRQKYRQQEQPAYEDYSTGYGEEYESFDDDEYYDDDTYDETYDDNYVADDGGDLTRGQSDLNTIFNPNDLSGYGSTKDQDVTSDNADDEYYYAEDDDEYYYDYDIDQQPEMIDLRGSQPLVIDNYSGKRRR